MRATSAPGTYLFSRLLLTPQIQALSTAGPEFVPYLQLLQLFAFGTYADYADAVANGQQLPKLNDSQSLKLRQLSFLTLARNPASLSYSALQTALSVRSASELEHVVVTAIYAGLLSATLDPYRQVVLVSRISPLRDPAPGSVGEMIAALKGWDARCSAALDEIERLKGAVRTKARERAARDERWRARVEEMLEPEIAAAMAPESGAATTGAAPATTSGGAGEGSGAGGSSAAGKKPVAGGSSGAAALAALQQHALQQQQMKGGSGGTGRYGKRVMADDADELDDEAMDVDEDEEEVESKKRASRRKL